MSTSQLRKDALNRTPITPDVRVERITAFTPADLADLCDATDDAIKDGIGFNWLNPPPRDLLEQFWQGALLVPERVLFGGRLDGVLCASVQLLKPPASKQTTAFAATVAHHFVAPWARGHGLARALLMAAEAEARAQGFGVIHLSVRSTQEAAITLYEETSYVRWGIQPAFERVGSGIVAGHHFSKMLSPMLIESSHAMAMLDA